ncbi:978_t:CDS:1, partial [Acaulospora colombiana]
VLFEYKFRTAKASQASPLGLEGRLTEIDCAENRLVNLTIHNFRNLVNLLCEKNRLKELNLGNCRNLVHLSCSDNELENLYLDNCCNLGYLDCSNNNLKKLDLGSCHELTYLYCENNQIGELNLTNPSKLEELHCSDNSLTDFNFDILRPEGVTELNFHNNKLSKNLSCFSRFVNLELLMIGNSRGDKTNRFTISPDFSLDSLRKSLRELKDGSFEAFNTNLVQSDGKDVEEIIRKFREQIDNRKRERLDIIRKQFENRQRMFAERRAARARKQAEAAQRMQAVTSAMASMFPRETIVVVM